MLVEVPLGALAAFAGSLVFALFVSMVERKEKETEHTGDRDYLYTRIEHWKKLSEENHQQLTETECDLSESNKERAKLQRQVTGLKSHVSRLRRERDNWKASFYDYGRVDK